MLSFHCPHCQKTLRTEKTIPQNSQILCPGCKQKFAMPAIQKAQLPAASVATKPSNMSAAPAVGIVSKPITANQSPPPLISNRKPAVDTLPPAVPIQQASQLKAPVVLSVVPASPAAQPTASVKPGLMLVSAIAGVLLTFLLAGGIWFFTQDADSPLENAFAKSADTTSKPAEVPQTKLAQSVNGSKTSQAELSKSLDAENGARKLKYGWKDGNKYTYRFEFSIDTTIRPQQVSGSITYSINQASTGSLQRWQKNRPASGGSGTALPTNPQLLALACTLRVDRDELTALRGFPHNVDMVIDDQGEIHPEYDRGPKPLFFNGIDTLGIEYVAGSGEKTWELKRKFSGLIFSGLRTGNNPNLPPGPPGQFPSGQFPLGQQLPGMPPGVSLVDVLDHTSYQTVEKNEQTLTLKKEHTMAKWQSSSSGEPRPFLQGTGTVTFDLAQGLPIASKMTYRAEDHPQLGTATYTYVYRFEKLRTAEEMKAIAKAEEAIDHTPEVKEIIKELAQATTYPGEAIYRLRKIAAIPQLREEVAILLNKYLLSEKYSEVDSTLSAVYRWGTEANREMLLQLMDSKTTSHRRSAIEILSNLFKTTEMAFLLGTKYSDPLCRETVERAWKVIGPPAEDAVIQTLQEAIQDSKTDTKQKQAISGGLIGILGKIGGKKSLDLLTAAQFPEKSGARKVWIDSALFQLRERLPTSEKVPAQ